MDWVLILVKETEIYYVNVCRAADVGCSVQGTQVHCCLYADKSWSSYHAASYLT